MYPCWGGARELVVATAERLGLGHASLELTAAAAFGDLAVRWQLSLVLHSSDELSVTLVYRIQ